MVNQQALDRTFGALADSTRRAIVARLSQGTASVGELAEPFEMSLPAVSKHLKVLEGAGLVVRRRDGRVHQCSLDAKPLDDAARWIEQQKQYWEGRFDALARFLDKTKGDTPPDKEDRK